MALYLRGLLIAYAIFTVRHVLRGENHAFQKEVTIYHYCIIEQMNSMVGGAQNPQQHVICSLAIYSSIAFFVSKASKIDRNSGRKWVLIRTVLLEEAAAISGTFR